MYYSAEGWRREYEKAALHLTGEIVWVRFQDPILKSASGCCMKSPDGFFIVDLQPDRDEMQTVFTFCHEMSHVLDDNLKPCYYFREAPLTDGKTPEKWQAHRVDPEEIKADERAWKWWGWALERITNHLRRDDPPGKRAALMLAALQNYPKRG